jgi:hypothetical protein
MGDDDQLATNSIRPIWHLLPLLSRVIGDGSSAGSFSANPAGRASARRWPNPGIPIPRSTPEPRCPTEIRSVIDDHQPFSAQWPESSDQTPPLGSYHPHSAGVKCPTLIAAMEQRTRRWEPRSRRRRRERRGNLRCQSTTASQVLPLSISAQHCLGLPPARSCPPPSADARGGTVF